ncbi:hypothetical protein IMSAG192_00126 [Muribaculaceae bacterium]|jgi:hypothetical protein|nr:hypothetical protein IMSAG192_00126 [Muribaculaceae bacterium]
MNKYYGILPLIIAVSLSLFMSEVGIDHDPIWDKIRERIG